MVPVWFHVVPILPQSVRFIVSPRPGAQKPCGSCVVPRGSTVGVTQETAIPCSETMWFLCGSTWFQAPVLNLVRTQTKRHVSAFEKPSRIIISKIGKRLARHFPNLLIFLGVLGGPMLAREAQKCHMQGSIREREQESKRTREKREERKKKKREHRNAPPKILES